MPKPLLNPLELTDQEAIQEMTDAHDFIRNYHKSPKFQERYSRYSKLPGSFYADRVEDYNTAVGRQQNYLNTRVYQDPSIERSYNEIVADAEGRYKEELASIEMETGETVSAIDEKFNTGEHYLLQGETRQPFTDWVGRQIKGRPNPEVEDIGPHYDTETNRVFVYKDSPKWLTSEAEGVGSIGGVSAHEFSHRASSGRQYYMPPTVKDFIKGASRNTQSEHDRDPLERKSDIDGFRYLLYKKGIHNAGVENFTEEDLNKAKQDPDIKNDFIFKRLERIFNDEDIIELMNLIAKEETSSDGRVQV